MSESTKAINVVRVRNERSIVGYWMVANLAPRAGSAFIYGELRLPAMRGEHLVGADRVGFADTPLVRAVQTWVANQVEDLAQKIERAMAKETRPEERERANDALSQFRELMRRYLMPEATPGELNADARSGIKDGLKRKPPLAPASWGKRIDTIVMEGRRKSIAIALGSKVPLDYRCYEQTDKGLLPVRTADVELVTEPLGIVLMNPDRSITGRSQGKTIAWLRDKATGVRSETIEI
jgi:hypothetical protein